MQKGQPHAVDIVHSTQWNNGMWWWGHCLWCKKVKPEDAVCSGIVVYGGGDIVFGAKRSNQWMQWTQWMQYAVCSGIVVYGGGDIVFGAKRSNQRMQWMQYAVHSGIVVCGGGDIVFGAKMSNQWMQYAVDTVE